jgi:uncharacterized NAD-dependent epimerase/dehydratase family protein
VAIALNTHPLSEAEAKAAIAAVTQSTGRPCTDVVRYGAAPILQAIMATPIPTVP